MGPLRIVLVLGCGLHFPGLVVGARSTTSGSPKEVTYTRDVAPILNKNCVVCRRAKTSRQCR